MEKEISNGIMLGIVLIALAVIIGLGFGIFSTGKQTANEGVTKVQANLANISSSEFQDYDQTVVTGTQVKSAYQNFEGKTVAVLISTTATIDQLASGTGTDISKGAGVEDAYGETADTSDLVIPVDGLAMTGSEGALTSDEGAFINYNAQLSVTGRGTADKTLKLKDGQLIANGGFRSIEEGSSSIVFNRTVRNFSKSGMMEYLSPISRFNSYVVKDATGSYIGVAFVQINNQ